MKNLKDMKSGGCYKCGGKVKTYNDGGNVTDDLNFYLYNPMAFMAEGGMTPDEENAMLEQQFAQQEASMGQGQPQGGSPEEQLIMEAAQILVQQGEEAAMQFLQQQGVPQEQLMEVLQIAAQVAQEMSQQGGDQQMPSEEEQMMMQQMAAQQGMQYGGLAKFFNGGSQNCPEGMIYDPNTGGCVQSGIPYAGNQPSYYDFGQGTSSSQNLGAQSFPSSFEEYTNRRIEENESQIADKDLAAGTRQNKEQFRDKYSRFFTTAEDAEAKVQKETSQKGLDGNQPQQQTGPGGYTLTHYKRLDKLKDPTKLDKTMAAVSGLASPSNVGMNLLRSMPYGKGLAALAGLISVPASAYMAGRKMTMKPVTEQYDAEGNLMTSQMGGEMDMYMMGGMNDIYSDVMANGGTWDMFHNNRPKFNIGMPVYSPGGPVGSETSPLPFAQWAQSVGYDQEDIKVPEIQQEYQNYVSNFSGSMNTGMGDNPASLNNQNQNNSSSANKMGTGKERVVQRGDAAGFLVGTNLLNAGYMMQDWAQEQDLKRTMRQVKERGRDAGNTMSMSTVNPVNPFGSMYTLNPGLLNQAVATAGYTQDLGTEYATAQYGGSTKYKQGGTYVLSEEEIKRIIQMGGEVEFLD